MAAGHFITTNAPFVPFEQSNFAQDSFRFDGQTAVVHAQVDGDQAVNFRIAMLGWSEYDGAGKLMRFPPETHPVWPWLYCRQVDFVRELDVPSAAGPSGSLFYKKVELACTFEAVPGVVFLSDNQKPAGADSEIWRYVHRRTEFEAHSRPLPQAKFLWSEDGKPLLEPGVRLEQQSTVYYTWFQIPAVLDANNAPFLPSALWTNIQSVVMHMNGSVFDGLSRWTALPIAPKLELRVMSNGRPCFDITYPALIRGGIDVSAIPGGTETPDFTRILRGTDGNYHKIIREADATKSIYLEGDLRKLFQTT